MSQYRLGNSSGETSTDSASGWQINTNPHILRLVRGHLLFTEKEPAEPGAWGELAKRARK